MPAVFFEVQLAFVIVDSRDAKAVSAGHGVPDELGAYLNLGMGHTSKESQLFIAVKAANPNGLIREDGADFNLAAEGFDILPYAADVRIVAEFQLRNRRLGDAQTLGNLCLRHLSRCTQLVEGHVLRLHGSYSPQKDYNPWGLLCLAISSKFGNVRCSEQPKALGIAGTLGLPTIGKSDAVSDRNASPKFREEEELLS